MSQRKIGQAHSRANPVYGGLNRSPKLPGQQHPTTAHIRATSALAAVVPRWMWLAMPDDAAQTVALAELMHPGHAAAQFDELRYLLRELARTQWRGGLARAARRPASLRPSKLARHTGYRTDSARHHEARMKVNPNIRAAIARKGANA